MCGIASILAYGPDAPPVDRGELLRISDRMSHRGPDGSGAWLSPNGRVGLGHRRLAIIDLSTAGAQPMANATGDLVVVFNGEIYNYRELRLSLEKGGCRFTSTSDTEVLLHLYAAKGRAMVHELRGMYAFAIWDQRNQGLFLARDPFGIKPLYYADDGKTFRAASQVKALLAGGEIDTAPEPAGHAGFFLWGHVPEPYTLYRGIRALPAGTSLWVGSDGRTKTECFCSISSELVRGEKNPVQFGEADVRRQLRKALIDSVSHHLIADVPVGLFLSSGLDSTTLAALAAEAGQGALHTVTLGFREYRGTANDETVLAELVARHYGTEHRTIWIGKEDFLQERENLLTAMDQPTIDGVNSYFVSLAAVRAGLKVAISGLGGDELFGGYPSFRQVPRMAGLLGLPAAVPGLGRMLRRLSTPLLKHLTSPKYAGLLEYGGSYGGAYLLRRGMFMPWELPELMDGEMARDGWRDLQAIVRLDETVAEIGSSRLKVSALEMNWYMRNQLLRDVDWASMAHSLEVRVPLVDIELLRNTVPMLAGRCVPDKLAMAATVSNPLPAEVLERRKTGFSVPLRDWLQGDNGRGLRSWAKMIYANHTTQ